jgi:hypothetical protein
MLTGTSMIVDPRAAIFRLFFTTPLTKEFVLTNNSQPTSGKGIVIGLGFCTFTLHNRSVPVKVIFEMSTEWRDKRGSRKTELRVWQVVKERAARTIIVTKHVFTKIDLTILIPLLRNHCHKNVKKSME